MADGSNAPLNTLTQILTGKLLTHPSGYLILPTDILVGKIDLKMPDPPAIDLFVENNGKVERLRAADQKFSPLALSNYPSVLISPKDLPVLRTFAEDRVLVSAGPAGLPVETRMTALRAAAISVVDDLFENPTPENIHRSSKIVASFVHVLMKDPKAFLHLTKLSSHDPYTLQHSVGAAVNSIIIARKIGIKSEKDLGDVGLGGLLHDIGKVAVRKEIINKPGPLDELEWEEMRQHVVEGYALVKDNPQVSELTKRAILEHHEDKMKSGYPARLAWTNVHLFSKIVGTSDIFNALTTNRSYSLAKTAFDALALMKEKMSHKIDDEIYRAMVLIYAGKIDDLLGQSSPAPGPAKTGGSKG